MKMLKANEKRYALTNLDDGTWQIIEQRTAPIAIFADKAYAEACLKLLNSQETEPQPRQPYSLPEPPPPPPPLPQPEPEPGASDPEHKAPRAPQPQTSWTLEEDAVLRRHENDNPRNYAAILQDLPNPSARSAKSISGRYARMADKARRATSVKERVVQPNVEQRALASYAEEICLASERMLGAAVDDSSSKVPAEQDHPKELHPHMRPASPSAALATPMALSRPPGQPAKTGPESGID
jgi:hypothetical protein